VHGKHLNAPKGVREEEGYIHAYIRHQRGVRGNIRKASKGVRGKRCMHAYIHKATEEVREVYIHTQGTKGGRGKEGMHAYIHKEMDERRRARRGDLVHRKHLKEPKEKEGIRVSPLAASSGGGKAG